MAIKKKFYAVVAGRKPGIYTEWFGPNGAEMQVLKYPKPVFKGFATRQEAESFMKQGASGTIRPARQKAAREPAATPCKRQQSTAPNGQVIMYTDGGCRYNPGPGGYGAVVRNGHDRREYSGGYRRTTNNRMELMACIVGLQSLSQPSSVILHSDSKYVVDGISKGWARKWRANGWKRYNREPALNADLWNQLLALCDMHRVDFVWVKGHAGIEENERCDQLATRSALQKGLPVDEPYELIDP
jgi:ribonuclease HI